MRDRAKKSIKYLLIILALGALYIFVWWLGLDIKCPFHELSGYLCPGCGLSRMLVSLLRLDIKSAAFYNLAGLLLLPFWISIVISFYRQYLKYGIWSTKKWHKVIFIISVAVFIAYGILRNITDLGLDRAEAPDFFGK